MSIAKPGLLALLCYDVYATNLALGRLYKPLLDPLGVTYPQYLVLMALWEEDGQGVGQIGRKLDLESNTLTPLIKRMETQLLLTRTRDSDDERRVLVRLTAAGRALQSKAQSIYTCVSEAMGLSNSEVLHLQTMLRRLRHSLTDPGHPNGDTALRGLCPPARTDPQV